MFAPGCASEGYAPLGQNTFQVRLERDGSIEFRYGDIAEKDGIVGAFCGPSSAGKLVDRTDLLPAPVSRRKSTFDVPKSKTGAPTSVSLSLSQAR